MKIEIEIPDHLPDSIVRNLLNVIKNRKGLFWGDIDTELQEEIFQEMITGVNVELESMYD